MKIQMLSDLHREAYRMMKPRFAVESMTRWDPQSDADVLVLAGDMDEAEKVTGWLLSVADRMDCDIVFVPGNHEYYFGVIEDELAAMREELAGSRVHLLDCDQWETNGVRFLGATLWTDFRSGLTVETPNLERVMALAGETFNDFRDISTRDASGNVRTFQPADALERHLAARAWLTEALAQPYQGKTIVVTHYGPCAMAQTAGLPRDEFAAGFWSDMTDLFGKVDVWHYGHTHEAIEEQIGRMLLFSNPAGYPTEFQWDYSPSLMIEV